MPKNTIINCAITGAIHVPTMSEYLPITPQEIADAAVGAAEAGSATLHIHARVPETGQPVSDAGIFKEICQDVKSRTDAVICITTGGGLGMTPEQRMEAVAELKPELASINMGSMNFALFPLLDKIKEFKHDWEPEYLKMTEDFIFKNTFYDMNRILAMMNDNGTKPEMECYDVGHIYNAAHYADKGLIKPPFWFQLILGIMGGIQPSVENLVHMKNTCDKLFGKDYEFSVLAAGRHQFNLCTVGAILGGAARVGMEDNLYLSKGVLAKSNGELVAKMVRILDELSMKNATPDEARQRLGLKGSDQTMF